MHGGQRISGAVSKAGSAGGLAPLSPVNACNEINVTLLVIPARIAGIQKPGIARLIHPCNLDPGIPCRGDVVAFLS
jgi:hypothetical protein